LGRPVNHDLLGRFVSAAVDGCGPCQRTLLDEMVADPVTTVRLVELACVAVQDTMGGLPANLLHPGRPGLASPEFRHLARAGAGNTNQRMAEVCQRMSPAGRRAAAETAADLLIGNLVAHFTAG
jgi:hypothetical protein